jgi:hypothetical protein
MLTRLVFGVGVEDEGGRTIHSTQVGELVAGKYSKPVNLLGKC